MFTAEQYRAKAAEFTALLANTPRSPNEVREFRDLEQTDCASTIGDLQQTTPLKGRIARFLHNHKDDRRS
jgi:hypothetical protein